MGLTDREYTISIDLKVIDIVLKNRIINEVLHQPKAYVEIIDTDSSVTTLSSCVSFSCSFDRNEILGSFSLTIDQANIWNPRTDIYENLLNIDTRKRINIYYGENLSGTTKYIPIYKGIVTKKPESYAFGSNNVISLSGQGLGYLFHKTDGTYINPTFTGSSKTLIKYWLDQTEIKYSLSYTDTINMTDQTIAFQSVLTGLNSLKEILGPNTEAYFDQNGRFVFKDISNFNAANTEFAYTQSNILSFERFVDTSKVTTVAVVTGATDVASSNLEASADLINQFGRNKKNISRGLITTATQAQNLAQALLDDGERSQNRYTLECYLNPYLTLGSFVTVEDSTLSLTSETQIRLQKINHNYKYGSEAKTTIEGYSE